MRTPTDGTEFQKAADCCLPQTLVEIAGKSRDNATLPLPRVIDVSFLLQVLYFSSNLLT